jgi:hypothetical protein
MATIDGPLDLSQRPSARMNPSPPQRPAATANEPSAARLVEQGGTPRTEPPSPGTEPAVGGALAEAGLPNLQGQVRSVQPSDSAGADPSNPMEGAGSTRVREIGGSAPGSRPMPGNWTERGRR